MEHSLQNVLTGLLIGLIQYLTGVGGGIILIPFFIEFSHFSLKVASIYSLGIISVSSCIGFFENRKSIQYKSVFKLWIISLVGTLFASMLKPFTPDSYIKVFYLLVIATSLGKLWNKNLTPASKTSPLKVISLGILWGVLVVFTGVGGGIILTPLLMSLYGLDFHTATQNSLFGIFLSSSLAFVLNYHLVPDFDFSIVATILLGRILFSLLVKLILKDSKNLGYFFARKLLFATCSLLSLISILRS